jgi:hypothetical protein
MVNSHWMAGPFDLIPSHNVFKSQACTTKLGAIMCGGYVPVDPWVFDSPDFVWGGGGVMLLVAP